MQAKPSGRVTRIQPAATLATAAKARILTQQGLDVINMGGGESDFGISSSHVGEATQKALEEGHTRYTASGGVSELREAIARSLRERNGLDLDPETEIIVTPGAKMAIFTTIVATLDQGDEAMILDPSWVSYGPAISLAGAVAVPVPLSKEDHFSVTAAKLQNMVTLRCKLMIVNSPNNPTGRVYGKEQLEAIAEVALENDLFVLSDEVYERFVYDGREHVSVATLPGMAERTITVSAFSKAYAMTGFRLGYLGAKKALAAQILKVQQHTVTCATSFGQYGGIAALTGPQDFVNEMVEAFHGRREVLTTGLNSLPGISCHRSEGTYYCFPDISGTGLTSLEFAGTLLEKARVAVVPGMAFGESGEGHVRMAFDNPEERIEEALERMSGVL